MSVCWKKDGTVKLYFYSSELHTFVEAKWVIAKFAFGGILIGIVILFGVGKLNQSVGGAIGSRSINILAAENNFLRQQVNLMSPRVSKLEMRASRLNERADKLHLLFPGFKVVRDTVLSFMNATNGSKPQSLVSAVRNSYP